MRSGTVLAAAGLVLAAVSACSTNADGEPRAVGSTESSAPQLPPRPSELDLTGLDPCAMLTPEQQTQLGFDIPPDLTTEPDRYGNDRCAYSRVQSEPRTSFSVKSVTQEDVTVYLDGSRNAEARVIEVAGFPTVEARLPGDERGCFVQVSTMEGQYLSVQYRTLRPEEENAQQVCGQAQRFAEMAMTTLLTQR